VLQALIILWLRVEAVAGNQLQEVLRELEVVVQVGIELVQGCQLLLGLTIPSQLARVV
jgi:hypothetical protein